MKKLLTICCLILSINAFGQENKKFRFGLSLNPSISDNIISNSGNTPSGVLEIYRNLEKPIFAYEISIFSQYALSQKSNLRVGFGFSNTGYGTEKTKTSFAVPDPTKPDYTRFIWQHQDIVIPILYSRYLKKENGKFYFIIGIEPQINVNRDIILKQWFEDGSSKSDKYEDTSTEFRKVNVNLLVGIGYDIKISPKNKIFIQPTFDVNEFGISKSTNLNRRIYTIGLTIGSVFL
jgi:hypothetical protein